MWRENGKSMNGADGCMDASVRIKYIDKHRGQISELYKVKYHYRVAGKEFAVESGNIQLKNAPSRSFYIKYGCDNGMYFWERRKDLLKQMGKINKYYFL